MVLYRYASPQRVWFLKVLVRVRMILRETTTVYLHKHIQLKRQKTKRGPKNITWCLLPLQIRKQNLKTEYGF